VANEKDSRVPQNSTSAVENLDESELVAQVRAGDAGALREALRRLDPTMRRYAAILCRQPDDAEEIAQDALILATRALPAFDGRAALSSWAWPIARTACNRRLRKRREELPGDGGSVELVDEAPSADELAELEQRAAVVRRAIARLPEAYRAALELRDVEGLSGDEAAERVGLSLEALKSRLHRARTMLRDELEREFGGPSPDTYCVDVARLLSARLEGELSPSDCERFEEHVRRCPSCGPACDRLREALAMCAQSGPKRAIT
jgi:RNA polymerase sigma-70 factor (ECF subfamily)